MKIQNFLLPFAIAAVCVAGLAALTGCEQSTSTSGPSSDGTAKAKVYTCEMHPEVISDKPGKCPKCGMTLIEKK